MKKVLKIFLFSLLIVGMILPTTSLKAISKEEIKNSKKNVLIKVNGDGWITEDAKYAYKQIFVNGDYIKENLYMTANYNKNTRTLILRNVDHEFKFVGNQLTIDGKKITKYKNQNIKTFVLQGKLYVPLELLLEYIDEDYYYGVDTTTSNETIFVTAFLDMNCVSEEGIKNRVRVATIKTNEIEQENLANLLRAELKKHNGELLGLSYDSSEITADKNAEYTEEWVIEYKTKDNKKVFETSALFPVNEKQRAMVKFLEPHKAGVRQYNIYVLSDISNEKEFKDRLAISNMLNGKLSTLDNAVTFEYVENHKEKISNKEYTVYTLKLNGRKSVAQSFIDSAVIKQLRSNADKILVQKADSPISEDGVRVISYNDYSEVTVGEKKYIIK